VKLRVLRSVPWPLKYLGPLSALPYLLAFLFSSSSLLFWADPWLSYAATSRHQSQFVWYRRLFCCFSSFAYFNFLQ